MAIRVLGSVEVDGGAELRPRDRLVLSALVVRRGGVVGPAEIADAVWGEQPPDSWSKQVQICIVRLRKVLGVAAIETADGGYRFTSGLDLDVDHFEQLVQRGRLFDVTGEPDRAVSAFSRALSTWRGPPFERLDGWPAARGEATRLEELHRTTQEDLLDARLAIGEHIDVAGQAEALVADEPLRERRWVILATAQYRCGRQGDALRTVQRARRTLLDQLGIDPGADLVTLEAAILRQDPALRPAPVRAEVSADCPYPGLASFDVGDADRFYGRDADVDACLQRLDATSLLVLAGPSGCGKSSLMRAGIIPALARRGRPAVVLVAGPGVAMPAPRADPPPIVAVDQLEELFVAGRPADEGRAFCNDLATYAQNAGPVIVAVRADHVASLAVDRTFSRLVEQGLHLVAPLNGEALREAIVRPATEAGLRVEEGLVDLIERDTDGEPGALPLMSHALAETWQHRDGNVLTVDGYRATGGIRAAVARSADRLYESLPPQKRAVLRSLLLRLVSPSMDGDPIRCRVPSRSLAGDSTRNDVLAQLVGARLVTAEEDTVELAHEALARAWPRLRSWLDEDAAGQRILRHLASAAAGWASLGRLDSELYRGARLETALEWRDSSAPDVTATKDEFLAASAALAVFERDALAQTARDRARQNRRLRTLLAATAALLVLALAAGVVAIRSAGDARDQRDVAAVAEESAQVAALSARSAALRSTNRAVAALLAVEAYRRWPDDAQARSALFGVFTGDPGFVGYDRLPGGQWLRGALVPETSSVVVVVDGRDLALYDFATRELRRPFPPAERDARGDVVVRTSADGSAVVHLVGGSEPDGCGADPAPSAGDERCTAASVYEVGGRRIAGPIAMPFGPGDVAISGDGTLVAAAGGPDGDAALYRVADGELVGTVAGLERSGNAEAFVDTATVTFGADGALYVGSRAGAVRVVDPRSLEVVATYDVPDRSANNHIAVLSDGSVVGAGDDHIVALDADGGVRWVVDLAESPHPWPCPWFAVAERARRMYCGNYFGVIEERDLDGGERTGRTLDPQLNNVGDLAVSADGTELVAFGASTPVISRWRLDGSGPITEHIAEGHVVFDGWDPTGDSMLVGVRPADAQRSDEITDFAIWDPAGDTVVDPFEFRAEGAGWSGPFLIAWFLDDPAGPGTYDPATRTLTRAATFPEGLCCTFQSAGPRRRTYVAADSGEVWTVDSTTQQFVEPTFHAGQAVRNVSATADGSRVAITTYGDDGTETSVYDGQTGERLIGPLVGPGITGISPAGVLVAANGGELAEYDPATLEPLGDFPGARGEINSLQFSADGTVLFATANDQTVAVYDVATRTRLGDPVPTASVFAIPGFLRPDGGVFAITDATGVAVWDLDTERQVEAACRLAGRNLSRSEWTTYLADLGPRRATCPRYPLASA